MEHVFVSYVRENQMCIERLCYSLRSHGLKVWLDRDEIPLGRRWRAAIRQAIQQGSYFLACFSKEYSTRHRTYMNEELTIAIDELRKRPYETSWFIPVRLSDCTIPDREIGGGESLADLQWVDLFEDWDVGISKILQSINLRRDPFRISKAYTKLPINDISGRDVISTMADTLVALKPNLTSNRYKIRVDGLLEAVRFNCAVAHKKFDSGYFWFDLDLGVLLNQGEEFVRKVECRMVDSFCGDTEYWGVGQPTPTDQLCIEVVFPMERICTSFKGTEAYGQDILLASIQPAMVGRNTLRWVVEKPEFMHSYKLIWEW